MKIFYKIKDNEFSGFYIEGINKKEDIFDISYRDKIINVDIEIENMIKTTEKTIKEEILTLKKDMFEIDKIKYETLINGGFIKYKNNDLINYKFPVKTKYYVKYIFDWNTETWEENATQEEFLQAKKEIEIEMRETYKNIEIDKVLGITNNESSIKLQELIDKLEYIISKILIKV